MINVPKPIKPIIPDRISTKDWLKGTVTANDFSRTPTDGLRASANAILDQDGTIKPRPSLVRYGTQPLGTILGEIFEFTRYNSTLLKNEQYLITVQNVSGTASVYVAKDGGTWQMCSGKTFSITALAHFSQADDKVLITNKVDNLAYLDIPTLTVIPFTGLSTPATPTALAAGLTGTTYSYYYKVTANSTVGETASSAAVTVQAGTQRELWVPASQYITVSYSAVTNALSYNIYLGDVLGQETLLAAGVNGLSFKDDGSMARDVTHAAPLGDTTAGPIVGRSTVINGQVFLFDDKNNPHYVRFGGTGNSIMDFSPFNGGGYTEVGRGTKELPVSVKSFRDGRGQSQITVLCRGTNGTGKRYILSPQTTTIGSTIISYFQVVEDNGQDGTDSPDAVILYRDSLWYPSRDGFKTTGTKPQLQNILSTDTITETIINDVKSLNTQYMSGAVGLGYQGRLYFAVPNGTSYNNEIWVLDLNRQGAWMKPWSISASWMMLYNDNSGMTHHLVLSPSNVVYELTEAVAMSDDGSPFSFNATSGFIKFSDDSLEWAKVVDVTFILLRPQGQVNFVVSGKTEDASLAALGSESFVAGSSVAGWGETGWGGAPDSAHPQLYAWSRFVTVPISYGDAQRTVTIDVDEELEWLAWEADANTAGTSFQIADVIVRFIKIGVKDLS